MKVSVIIPVYNVEGFIIRCLDSVRDQDYPEIEVILVDDKGSDDSVHLASAYIERYGLDWILLENPQNIGVSASRNNGLHHATGDYVFFLDSDDTISVDCISTLVANCSDDDIVIGNYSTVQNGLSSAYRLTDRHAVGHDSILEMYADGNCFVMPWNKMCKRSFLLENGLFFKEGLAIHEDMLWTVQSILLAKSVTTVAKCTYSYYIRPGSAMTSLSIENDVKAYIVIFDEILSFIKEKNIGESATLYEILEAKKSALMFSLINIGCIEIFNQYYPSFRKNLLVNPLVAFRKQKISLKSLVRDFHYCLLWKLGAIYKRLSFFLGFTLRKKELVDPYWPKLNA